MTDIRQKILEGLYDQVSTFDQTWNTSLDPTTLSANVVANFIVNTPLIAIVATQTGKVAQIFIHGEFLHIQSSDIKEYQQLVLADPEFHQNLTKALCRLQKTINQPSKPCNTPP